MGDSTSKLVQLGWHLCPLVSPLVRQAHQVRHHDKSNAVAVHETLGGVSRYFLQEQHERLRKKHKCQPGIKLKGCEQMCDFPPEGIQQLLTHPELTSN